MGFSPAQVDDMSLWEFGACVAGWRKANAVDKGPRPPTAEEHMRAIEFARMNAAPTVH